MQEISIPKRNVAEILNEQRTEGEARELLRGLEALISLRSEQKRRWVWELIQNAQDCAPLNGKVNIRFILSSDKLVFEHDGSPFEVDHLIAITRKTSTKSIEGVDGKAGKFGTGFVTTQVLNRSISISGILRNETGDRPFLFILDRTADTLPELMKAMGTAYTVIDSIDNLPPVTGDAFIPTKYTYSLDAYKFQIAVESLRELERNLGFTLLVNGEQINSVSIIQEQGVDKIYTINTPIPVVPGIYFSRVSDGSTNDASLSEETGLLYLADAPFLLAVPCKKNADVYELTSIVDQARIFRSFPLLGTENAHFPCFVHSTTFQPTEERDGIRIYKENESLADRLADANRAALEKYAALFKDLLKALYDSRKVNNLHLLAESGVPDNTDNYISDEWFKQNIQKGLREELLTYDLVRTKSGKLIKIGEARFIRSLGINADVDAELFWLAAELYPDQVPDDDSYRDWIRIMNQDPECEWPQDIHIGIKEILKTVSEKGSLEDLKPFSATPITWINRLINFIHANGHLTLADEYTVFPNQSSTFVVYRDLRRDAGLDDRLKDISKHIFRNVYDQLLHKEIWNKTGIPAFDLSEFFDSLNTYIGNLEINQATSEQISAIFQLGCCFRNTLAAKRSEWFSLINELVPALAPQKVFIADLDDYNFETVDRWTLKYICSQITLSGTITSFQSQYFDGHASTAYTWLNRFLDFALLNDEKNRDTSLKFAIVPNQLGVFSIYDDSMFREDNPKEFEGLFKELIREELGQPDPRTYLIDTEIKNTHFRTKDISSLADIIDRIFNEDQNEYLVEDGKKYNKLFHRLNYWYGENWERGRNIFPVFSGKRPRLSVKAYGNDISKIVMDKGMEEIKALSGLTLAATQLKQLEEAAKLVGGAGVLIDYAKAVFEDAEMIRWRKLVGTAAEEAFVAAMKDIDTEFRINNPDDGMDFIIKSKTSENNIYYLEIKSTVIGSETVKMSIKQGDTAFKNKEKYALCVIARPAGTLITKEYFEENVRFVPNIGELIGNKLEVVKNNIENLKASEAGDVNVMLDNKNYAVYIRKSIWDNKWDFKEFIEFLKGKLQ